MTDMIGPPASEPVNGEEEEYRLATRSLAAGDPTGWFEQLYAAGESGRIILPWSRTEPHPAPPTRTAGGPNSTVTSAVAG